MRLRCTDLESHHHCVSWLMVMLKKSQEIISGNNSFQRDCTVSADPDTDSNTGFDLQQVPDMPALWNTSSDSNMLNNISNVRQWTHSACNHAGPYQSFLRSIS